MSSHREIIKSAWGITAWTAVARVTGLVREAIVARYLGASAVSDAFVTAFRIPNTFRAIVGEGGLPGAFVPMAKKVERESPGKEGTFAGRFAVFLGTVVVGLVIVGVLAAPVFVMIFARGFQKTPGKFEMTVFLTRLLFPYILFISMAALLEAYLNAKGRFQLAAATPVLFNVSIILCAIALIPLGVPPPIALSTGVLLGGLGQFLMQLPLARRLGMKLSGSPMKDPMVRETAVKIVPRLYGFGVGQINLLISSNVLAALGDAFVTYNYFAFRMADLVRGGFVESITRTILPSLSEKALEADQTAFRKTIVFGLRLSAFVTLPATAALAILASPVIDIAFRRGRFQAGDVEGTTLALVGYAFGLFAIGGVKILTQAFYALHDTRTPVVVATFDLVAFLVICLALARPMKHAGVALATSAGFWINFILLFILLMKRVPGLLERELWKSAARLSAATVVSGLSTLALVRGVVPYPQASSLVLRTTWLLAAVAAGSLVYLAGARLLGAPEVGEVLGVFRRRRARA